MVLSKIHNQEPQRYTKHQGVFKPVNPQAIWDCLKHISPQNHNSQNKKDNVLGEKAKLHIQYAAANRVDNTGKERKYRNDQTNSKNLIRSDSHRFFESFNTFWANDPNHGI